jgi:hypothetical protein
MRRQLSMYHKRLNSFDAMQIGRIYRSDMDTIQLA